MFEHLEAAIAILRDSSSLASEANGKVLPAAYHHLFQEHITKVVASMLTGDCQLSPKQHAAFRSLESALRLDRGAWLLIANTPGVKQWPPVNIPPELAYDPALFDQIDVALKGLRNSIKANRATLQDKENETTSFYSPLAGKGHEQLPKTDTEADLLKPVLAEFLRTIPEIWVEFELDRLTAIQENALFLLTTAGMVERRGWLRSTIANHPTCFEVRFQATGEGGIAKSLEHLTAIEYTTWCDAWQAWCIGETKDASPFHPARPRFARPQPKEEGILAIW